MARIFIIGAAAVLVLHSLIHLMGTAVYMRLPTLEGFAYKTTLLGGRWDLGTSGTWGFGLLWLLAGMPLGIGDVAGFPILTLIGIGMTIVLFQNVSDGAPGQGAQIAPAEGRVDQAAQALPAAGQTR